MRTTVPPGRKTHHRSMQGGEPQTINGRTLTPVRTIRAPPLRRTKGPRRRSRQFVDPVGYTPTPGPSADRRRLATPKKQPFCTHQRTPTGSLPVMPPSSPTLRGTAAAYRTSARDAFLSGNGTDPMHGRKTTAARPTMNRSYGSAKAGPPRKKSPGPTHLHSVDGSCASHRRPQRRSRRTRNVQRNRGPGPQSHVACNRDLHEVVSAEP
jgi:hypothetical protein